MNDDQQRAFDLFVEGRSFFLTGSGGCGKSYLLAKFVESARERGRIVQCTALTGQAALLVDGKTVHSFLGLGLGTDPFEVLLRRIRMNATIAKRWRTLDVLLIDEVSMMSLELFELIEQLARVLRRCEMPMGGIQTVVSGDFFQLPPVSREGDAVFCFESPSWRTTFPTTVELRQNMRQSDPTFQALLDEVRRGVCSVATRAILRGRMDLPREFQDGIEPTRLYSTNADIDAINDGHMRALEEPIASFQASYTVREVPNPMVRVQTSQTVKAQIERGRAFVDRNANCASVLQLCRGAQVMLLVNLDFASSLVNGSRGVVVGFGASGGPLVRFANGETREMKRSDWSAQEGGVTVVKKQLPLKLAYAITIHRSQGSSLDLVEMDLSNVFEAGMAYVALSRARTLEGLRLIAFDPERIRAHPKVLAFMNE
jgi:ATP-dependent DNA helicase PIF1